MTPGDRIVGGRFPLGQLVITSERGRPAHARGDRRRDRPARPRRLGRPQPGGRRRERAVAAGGLPAAVGLRPGRPPLLDHHRGRPLGHDRPVARGLLKDTDEATIRTDPRATGGDRPAGPRHPLAGPGHRPSSTPTGRGTARRSSGSPACSRTPGSSPTRSRRPSPATADGRRADRARCGRPWRRSSARSRRPAAASGPDRWPSARGARRSLDVRGRPSRPGRRRGLAGPRGRLPPGLPGPGPRADGPDPDARTRRWRGCRRDLIPRHPVGRCPDRPDRPDPDTDRPSALATEVDPGHALLPDRLGPGPRGPRGRADPGPPPRVPGR